MGVGGAEGACPFPVAWRALAQGPLRRGSMGLDLEWGGDRGSSVMVPPAHSHETVVGDFRTSWGRNENAQLSLSLGSLGSPGSSRSPSSYGFRACAAPRCRGCGSTCHTHCPCTQWRRSDAPTRRGTWSLRPFDPHLICPGSECTTPTQYMAVILIIRV